MDKPPASPRTGTPLRPFLRSFFNSVFRSAGRPAARAGRRIRACLMSAAAFLPLLAEAQTTPTNNILTELRAQLGPILTIGLQLLLVGGFATAGYIIITGAIRVMNDREGGLARFGLGILVAIVMIAFTVYLVQQGSDAVTKIEGP